MAESLTSWTAPGGASASTPAERTERGRAARAAVPRSVFGEFAPAAERPDPIELLGRQDISRVPELLPIRYGRMAATPFSFFRGAAAVMAADLAPAPTSGLTVQACGDAHLSNFGFFASPERRLVFDINDFDETLPGPWEWDVKRLAASLEIAARDRGFPDAQAHEIVETAGRSYREAIRAFAGMPNLEVWYALADVEQVKGQVEDQLNRERRKRLDKGLAKARTRDNLGALARFATTIDGRTQFKAEPPLVVPLRDLYADVSEQENIRAGLYGLLSDYMVSLPPDRRILVDSYRPVDIARKVVGVGSVGTRSWMLLLLGRDEGDPLFLQAKEAGRSVLEDHLPAAVQSNAGARVVDGQRLMQTVGDIFLGWVRVNGFDGKQRDFYVRQLRDWKGSVEVEVMVPSALRVYAQICGWTLARSHARSGDRIALAGYLGSSTAFERALVRFAHAYAEQNEKDHRALVEAIADGRVAAQPGV